MTTAVAPKERILLACAGTFWLVFIARTLFRIDGHLYSTLFDDAMISMRYARNFADGHGLVWNAGGAAVQGYTNPLWTFVMVGVHAAGVPPRLAALVLMGISAAVLLGASLSARNLTRDVTGREDAAGAALALTAFAYPLVFWTLRGMEVGLLAWLVTVAAHRVILYSRGGPPADLRTAGILMALALWTRADALVPALVLGAYVVLLRPREWRALAATGLAAGFVGVAGPMIFSQWYYGSPLPNTYYLKLGGVTLAQRVARGIPSLLTVSVRSLLGAFVPVAALAMSRPRGRAARELALLGVLFAAQCGYSIFVGGDAWEWMGYANRYVALAIPILSVLTAAGLAAMLDRGWVLKTMPVALPMVVAAHAGLVLFLLRANRGIDTPPVELFRAQPAVVTAVIVVAGFALLVAALLASLRRSMSGLAVAVWLVTSGVPAARWAASNGFLAPQDARAARLGLLLRETLAPEATYAISWAGSTPYFAERTAVDLLGKSDPVIARMPPAIPEFVPGHNKWSVKYSVGELRPDLACNLPRREWERAYLSELGYRQIGWTCYVRAGARLDEGRLVAGMAALDPGSVEGTAR
jgi:arabinofuranosyltransferase